MATLTDFYLLISSPSVRPRRNDIARGWLFFLSFFLSLYGSVCPPPLRGSFVARNIYQLAKRPTLCGRTDGKKRMRNASAGRPLLSYRALHFPLAYFLCTRTDETFPLATAYYVHGQIFHSVYCSGLTCMMSPSYNVHARMPQALYCLYSTKLETTKFNILRLYTPTRYLCILR